MWIGRILRAAVLVHLLCTHARAASLELSATPILGQGAPVGPGWNAYVVHVKNTSTAPFRGHVELRANEEGRARAPVSLGAREEVRVQLDWHVREPTLEIRAVDENGRLVAGTVLTRRVATEPLLFDLSATGRLAAVLRGESVAVGYSPPGASPVPAPSLSITRPETERTTGELVLPDRAASYNGATVVLIPSDRLAGLSDRRRRALADWILAGGTAALVVTRPEDLRTEPLSTLVGGRVLFGPPPASILVGRTFRVPVSTSPNLPPHFAERYRAPERTTLTEAQGYEGANLRPTPFGAAATYGLGEIHLLAFDPSDPSLVMDPWVQLSVLDLVRHGWDRRAHVALPHASSLSGMPGTHSLRRIMDPNEGARWAVMVCAVALLLYAFVAGPVNFAAARRAGTPLRALARLPWLSAAALLFVVATGLVAKGGRGQARHLAVVEAGAGMGRAAVTRYRALFASTASTLDVSAYDPFGVLDVIGSDDAISRTLTVSRDEARLEHIVSRPWETMIVREDGFANLGGGVSLVQRDDGEVIIKNRLARDLTGVVLGLPGGAMRFFSTIADGTAVGSSAGEPVPRARIPTLAAPSSGLAELAADRFLPRMERLSPDLRTAWEAVFHLVGHSVDFWPGDVPVMIGAIDGGGAHAHDSGLPVERDQLLVRVVGYGGAL